MFEIIISLSLVEELVALVGGGWNGENDINTTEIVPNDKCNRSVRSLPVGISSHPSMILTPEEEILICGGSPSRKKCLELKKNKGWQFHSNLNAKRSWASAVTMPDGVYIFGGYKSKTSWEWLPKGAKEWEWGNNSIPNRGFYRGCAVKINDLEIILIGGHDTYGEVIYGRDTYKRVMKFNTFSKKWTNLGNVLNQGRRGHACVRFGDKIIVAGGRDSKSKILASTEIINLHDLKNATTSGDLGLRRSWHGIVVVHIDDKPTAMAVGGYGIGYMNSVETWNPDTETWSIPSYSFDLSERRGLFGILSLPARLLCL